MATGGQVCALPRFLPARHRRLEGAGSRHPACPGDVATDNRGTSAVSITLPATKKRWTRGLEEDEHQGTLHGELAGLDVKFQVNLNPSYCSNHGTVYLICKLNDKKLPSVPPLQLSISADYPNQSPYWTDDEKQYTANTFLLTVHKLMTSRLHRLPRRYSVTALLNIWDQSVTKASLPAA
ncbi:mediator of RNA polymerase II transcription subunit 15 [Polymixia lowei]